MRSRNTIIHVAIFAAQLAMRPGGHAVADDITAAQKILKTAASATWETRSYAHYENKETKQHRWNRIANENKKLSYKSPGLYRTETVGERGDVKFVLIQDVVQRASLFIDPIHKTATLSYSADPPQDPRGPFALVERILQHKDLQLLGEKQENGRRIRGFRHSFFTDDHNQAWSYECWLDDKTGSLVTYQVPGSDLLKPEDKSEVAHDWRKRRFDFEGIAYTGVPGLSASGYIVQNIKLGPSLDDSLFSLEPPRGYRLDTLPLPKITEKDVLDFMRIVAEYFGGAFPDQLPRFNHGKEYDRFEHIENFVPKAQRTPAENAMVEAMQMWWSKGIPGPGPLHVFIHNVIVEGSWHYVGNGVKLGDKNRIVCWYRPKSSTTYRAVFGDLSVKEMSEADLPREKQPAGGVAK